MKVSEPKREGVVVKFDVELTADELKPHIDQAYEKARKTIKIDGFRQGKVPRSVIEKKYGDAILSDALDDIIQKVYPDALDKADVNPLTPGRVEGVVFDPAKELKFTAVVEVEPEVKADKWKDVEVEREAPQVTDKDVQRHIDTMRREQAIVSERSEGEGIEEGDRVVADIQQVDESGAPIIGTRQEDQAFEASEDAIQKDILKPILGAKVGDSVRVKTEQPDPQSDPQDPKMTTVPLDITIKKIEKVELPEIDEEFVKSVNDKLETVDDLKKDVREQLQKYADYQANQRMAGRLIDAVVEAHDIEVPPTLKQQTLEQMVKSRREETGNMVPEEELRKQLEPLAEQQLRWFFLRKQLIDDLDLEATDEDIDKHVEDYASRHEDMDAEELKKIFKQPEQRQQLADEIVQGKLMEALRDGVKIKEKKVDFTDVLR